MIDELGNGSFQQNPFPTNQGARPMMGSFQQVPFQPQRVEFVGSGASFNPTPVRPFHNGCIFPDNQIQMFNNVGAFNEQQSQQPVGIQVQPERTSTLHRNQFHSTNDVGDNIGQDFPKKECTPITGSDSGVDEANQDLPKKERSPVTGSDICVNKRDQDLPKKKRSLVTGSDSGVDEAGRNLPKKERSPVTDSDSGVDEGKIMYKSHQDNSNKPVECEEVPESRRSCSTHMYPQDEKLQTFEVTTAGNTICNMVAVEKKPKSKDRQKMDGVEGQKKVASSSTKKAKVGLSTSVHRAASMVNSELKHKKRKVLLEDGNITVYQDVYKVVYKNTDDVYKLVTERLNELVTEANERLTRVFEKKMKNYNTELERLMNRNLSRLRKATTTSGKDTDTHSFVIITPKTQAGSYHMATAFDTNDLTKKLNRCKNVDKLLLEFNKQKEFNVGQLKNIMKEEKMMTKAKNDFCFNGGDLRELQKYLIKIIDESSSQMVHENDYKISYLSGEKSTTPKAKKRAITKKKQSSKDEVRRSLSEEYTDESSDEREEEEEVCDGQEEEEEECDDEEQIDEDIEYVEEEEEASGNQKENESDNKRKRTASDTECEDEDEAPPRNKRKH